jgi:uncharacterized protein
MTNLSLFAKISKKRKQMKRQKMKDLIAWQHEKNRKPLLLKGVRQVGKTHLLKQFGKLHFPQFHYFNFEKQPHLAKFFEPDLDPQRILSDLSFYSDSPIKVGEDLVIFDEIQEVPKALTSLKYFCEECPKLHLCGAGSLLGIHLNSESFPVGKVSFKTLKPMSFEEFLVANHDKALPIIENLTSKDHLSEVVHEHLWEQFKHYLIVGGLPEAVSTYCEFKKDLYLAFTHVREKQEDLLNTYYADISKHSGKVNAMHINRCIFHSIRSPIPL